MKKCIVCKEKLASHNNSGYCTECYVKSPQWAEYQRKKQKEYYYKHKDRKKAYRNRPKVKRKIKEYQKRYHQEHKEELKKYKKDWARRNKSK